jgi:WD40 repeat protein
MEKEENTIQTNSLNIFLGSYEGKVFCVEMNLKTKDIKTFSFKASDNSIKVITNKDSFIFVSGVDEIIHMYNYKKKEELGMVVSYSGTISNIQIFKSFLFAAGDEPNIAIWRMSDFSPIHNLKGHKKAINHFIIHKTGRFAVSASKDNSIIIWNLLAGKAIIKYKLKELICNKLLFIKNQKLVVLIFDNEFWLFDLFKETDNYEEYVLKKVKVENKIFDAYVVGSNLFIFHIDGSSEVYTDVTEESYSVKPFKLDKPSKAEEDELDVRIKLVNVACGEKFNLLNVVYSNNEIYIYDMTKIIKNLNTTAEGSGVEGNDAPVIKKFRSINLKTNERITCVNSQIK